MIKKSLGRAVLMAGVFCANAALQSLGADACEITPTEDGGIQFQNALIDVLTSPTVGRDKGITSWQFLPTGQNMIDRNRLHKTILGEGWDSIAFNQVPGGMPFEHRDFYAPVATGRAADGSAVGIIQEAKGTHSLRRTTVMRRDYSVLKMTWSLENISEQAVGGAFRFFSAAFPGALTGTTLKGTSIFVPTEQGVLELDQNLHSAVYREIYGDTKFFQPRWANSDEPLRGWVRRDLATPFAKGYWACEVNRNNGNGLFFIGDPKTLIGFYNDPGTTLETVMEAIALQPGEQWETSILVGSFAVPKGMKVSDVNPLFVTCGEDGVVPLFRGHLVVGDQRYAAEPNVLIEVKPITLVNATALDAQGNALGAIKDGVCEMSPEGITYVVPEKPEFSGDVYDPNASEVAEFLKSRNFTVYCGFENRRDVKRQAEAIALQLGVGIAYTKPEGAMLAIGAADDDRLVQNIGLMNNSVSASWPGEGKGGIRYFPKLSISGSPAVIIAGTDVDGVLKALSSYASQHMTDVTAPSGFDLHVVPTEDKIYPYSRSDANSTDRIAIQSAKGEYESAQLILTAFDAQKNINVTVSDLVHAETGKKMSNKYITHWRRQNGPVLVRWVDYFPYDAPGGFTGYPDPLFERAVQSLPAGQSQAIWLTFIVPEAADAGTYTATVTCQTGDGTKTIPIELKVWDFAVPRDGLMGRAYAHLQSLPKPGSQLKDNDIDIYVRNLVEHGMRFINLTALEMFRWHFSEEGAFKDLGLDWQEVSADGKLMMDASAFDHIKMRADQAGQPFDLIYMIYEAHTFYQDAMKFKRAFPDRHEAREGHPVINSRHEEEMMAMLVAHLKKRSWLDQVYLKIGDEPGNLTNWYNDLCQAAVGAGMPFFTAHGSSDLSTGTPEMSDVWMPIYGSYDETFMQKAREAGKLISFYNCGPPPTTAVNVPATEWRSYLWQAAKLDLDIVCWWGIQCWNYYDGGAALWRDRYSHWNSVIYPEHPEKEAFYVAEGPNRGWKDQGMIDSIRWETIRDGMEDAWYVNALRRLMKTAREAGHVQEADDAEAVLDGIWESTYPDRQHYRPPFENILTNRRMIAEQILKLKALPEKP